MQKRGNNFAFIDGQNVYVALCSMGWKLDWQRFYVYLQEKYAIRKAYIFLGYVKENKKVYYFLRSCGYILIFKPITYTGKKIKGNVDAELVLQAMADISEYDKALIVSGDGDFYCLVKYLKKQNKLLRVLIPNHKKYSFLLKRFGLNHLDFLHLLKDKLAYKKTPIK